ncbi:MAG: hypothetical protein GF421_02820 [Candidatus Aminicenantes bacterium]|nr:hypothetical protein [Candidatus Aminicenantes bacterium]
MKYRFIAGLFMILFAFVSINSGAQVIKIGSQQDLPEDFSRLWEKGDYVIKWGEELVLLGGVSRKLYSVLNYPTADAKGVLLSLVPSGKGLSSDLVIGVPYLRAGGDSERISYSSITQKQTETSEDKVEFLALAKMANQKFGTAKIETLYQFLPGEKGVRISSVIVNIGEQPMKDFQYSLYMSAQHKYGFSPSFDKSGQTRLFKVFQKKGHYIAWLEESPHQGRTGASPVELAPGEEFKVQYILFTDTDAGSLLADIYEFCGQEIETLTLSFVDPDRGLMEVLVEDVFSSTISFRSFLEDPHFIQVPVPAGVYKVSCRFFPAVKSRLIRVEKGKDNTFEFHDASKGTILVKIRDHNQDFVPGKVTFIGLYPTRSPYFEPENPTVTGRYWETFKNSCYPQEMGAEVALPVGTYLVYASRGPEYSMDKKIVEVLKNQTDNLTFHIDKAVKTPGLVSVDTHMHTLKSDGRVSISERIKSVVAEGVDVAIATDHNCIMDYSPVLKKMGYKNFLRVISGNEVSTGGVIHYNSYPLLYREAEELNGAINPDSEEVSPLFESSRRKDPGSLIQVNHPRSGSIGYFNNYALDPESAAAAQEKFDLSFDVLEVLNGPYYYSSNHQSIQDWLHLLNRGYYFPIVASSDAHGIDGGEPGYSRTYVICDDPKKEKLDQDGLLKQIKLGHSFLSNGPIVDFKVNEEFIPGDTVTLKSGRVDVFLTIKAAPWVSTEKVRIIINGQRRVVLPLVEPTQEVQRYFGRISFDVTEDSYIAVEVLGHQTLYPVLQRPASDGIREYATLPYALTNPVFIDVNGNGRFDPPNPEQIKFVSPKQETK